MRSRAAFHASQTQWPIAGCHEPVSWWSLSTLTENRCLKNHNKIHSKSKYTFRVLGWLCRIFALRHSDCCPDRRDRTSRCRWRERTDPLDWAVCHVSCVWPSCRWCCVYRCAPPGKQRVSDRFDVSPIAHANMSYQIKRKKTMTSTDIWLYYIIHTFLLSRTDRTVFE